MAPKSEKLASALETAQPIIIVTIQTFPYVLKAIENSVSLKQRKYAVIADEAHSSKYGSTAKRLKEVLLVDYDGDEDKELGQEDIFGAIAARRHNVNLNYYAFTATPKSKTLELFGRVPDPSPCRQANRIYLQAYHVYSHAKRLKKALFWMC